MRVLLTGATGFIGRALVPALLREGHESVAWVRSAARARQLLGAEVLVRSGDGRALAAEMEQCDAVVNLAGEPLIGRRWTQARRRQLVESRVAFTERLVSACRLAGRRPRVLISGSAVGYYGDRGSEVLTEDAAAGNDFLAKLCVSWESAARVASELGMRVVILRTGIVLGREGGALGQLLLPFGLGLGGPMGSGRQHFPWIHLHDVVRIVIGALTDARYEGPLNLAAPEETTNRGFTRALGRALHRPAIVPMPAVALRLLLGASAGVLLSSQRARPERLQGLGFQYSYSTLANALADLVGTQGVEIRRVRTLPSATDAGGAYLTRGRARYELRTTTRLDVPLQEAFRFFSSAENLGLITPAAMNLRIEGTPPATEDGAAIDYELRMGPLPIRWRSRIIGWEPGRRFVDIQERGPYRLWWHEHVFRAEGRQTIMEDHVCYAPPLGPLGALVHPFVVAPLLRRIFAYRRDVMRLRFGGSS